MVKLVIHSLPVLRIDFMTKLIFIHQTIQICDIRGKSHNPNNHVMDNNIYIFFHITHVTPLSIADLTPKLSESNYIYPCYK